MWIGLDNNVISVNRRRILNDYRFSVLDTYQNEWNLRIESVTQKDAGEYTCKLATNPATESIVILIVNGKCEKNSTIFSSQ